MGTLQDELYNKVIMSPKRKIVKSSFNFLKQESTFNETVGFLNKIKKQKSTIKINKRKERRGKVIIMSDEEIKIMARKDDIIKLRGLTLNNPVLFNDLYNKFYSSADKTLKKITYLRNLCQEFKSSTNKIFHSSKNGWFVDEERLVAAECPDLISMWQKNKYFAYKRNKKKTNSPEIIKDKIETDVENKIISDGEFTSELDVKEINDKSEHNVESDATLTKSATITFFDNKIIIERKGCSVEVISSGYEIVKIIL